MPPTTSALVGAAAVAAAALSFLLLQRRWRRSPVVDLKGQVVVVTGASSGIGRSIAILAAKQRAVVVVAARRQKELQAVADECTAAGAAGAVACPCDITKEADCERLAATVAGLGKPLGLLVLNAGRGGIAPFARGEEVVRIAKDLMDVNYFANLRLMQLFLGQLRAAKGQVLVVSSLSGVLATPQRTTYCASKFAVQGFFNSLRQELAQDGVHVTVACPGFVKTEFHHNVATPDGKAPEREAQGMMSPEECARRCFNAALCKQDEMMVTWGGYFGTRVRPFLSQVIDGIAARKANASLKKQSKM